MKTDDLIDFLAVGDCRVESHALARRFVPAIGLGMLAAALMMAALLGVRRDLAEAMTVPEFWVKAGFVVALAAACLAAMPRVSRPGVPLAWALCLVAAPPLVLWVAAAAMLVDLDPAQRAAVVLGQTWKSCPFLIALLSLPPFLGILWAMRGLAPTRLRLAGALGGFLSGALAACVYSLHCPELAAPFVATWYLLGISIPALAGALFGPVLLRW